MILQRSKEAFKTERQLQQIKRIFLHQLSQALNADLIASPLILDESTGLNDNLNGIEKAVAVEVTALESNSIAVIHSLAKWKRWRLAEYQVTAGKGIITDMRALRTQEKLGPIHSVYVDQWDWECVIREEERTLDTLKATVSKIYFAIRSTATQCELDIQLPQSIFFIHAEELLRLFPSLTPKEREHELTKIHGAVCIIGIGAKLSNGQRHDDRAPDYDDWSTVEGEFQGLNADILVWHEGLKRSVEISSMGIRVNAEAMEKQLTELSCKDRMKLPFHQAIATHKLPASIGGGIGQSRLCMLLLQKLHIGEVQVSLWPETMKKECLKKGIHLL